jgi:hypothetical protein
MMSEIDETDPDMKKINLILQNVLFNWEQISTEPQYKQILDLQTNNVCRKLRMDDIEETDKMIQAKAFAFTLFMLSNIIESS